MELLPITYKEAQVFFFIMIRISVILFMFPFFNARVIPVLSKAGLALMISIIMFPVVNHNMIAFPDNPWGIVQFIITELIIGMILGLMVQLFFEAVRMMGQLVGFQTGFSITNIIDPQNGVQVSILSNFAYLVAMVIFLILNGHHLALNAIRESFEIINVGSLNLNKQIFEKIIFSFRRDVRSRLKDRGAGHCGASLYKGGLCAGYKTDPSNEYHDCRIPCPDRYRPLLFRDYVKRHIKIC